MALPCSTGSLVEEPLRLRHDVVLVADLGNPVAADYAAHLGRGSEVRVVRPGESAEAVSGVVLFLGTRAGQLELDEILARDRIGEGTFVGIVSSFEAHLGNRAVTDAEAFLLARLTDLRARVVVFRPGFVLTPGSRATRLLSRFAPFYPLVPSRLRGCCVEGDELFAAIERERCEPRRRRPRLLTLLGPNRPWRERLAERRTGGLLGTGITVVCTLFAWLLVGHLGAVIFSVLSRWKPSLRRWNFDTLRPTSMRELLALCNPYDAHHVRVVGYNNGVVHFGQHFPGKTVVSTVHLDRVVRAGPAEIRADAGVTIRKALDFLASSGQTLYVIPNYSYVCLGTSFFVPIHGSAADYSCVAETITRVLLYDPRTDRLIRATRDEPAFRDHVYHPGSGVVLLRTCLRVKAKSRYFVHQEERDAPSAADLVSALRDDRPTNVEIRKSSASTQKVRLYRYYRDPDQAQGANLVELPRDSLGRLWDRLEENAITSFLLHRLTRHFAFHVELFFTAEEFARFWETHHVLPLRKIQVRYLRRDGFPNSAFRDHDCVSVDLFLFRRHRRTFEEYLKQTFAVIRANPGKHST